MTHPDRAEWERIKAEAEAEARASRKARRRKLSAATGKPVKPLAQCSESWRARIEQRNATAEANRNRRRSESR